MAKSKPAETEVAEAAPVPEAATSIIQITELQFTVPAPYAEGHPLTSNEADALNGLLGENIRNNFRARVQAAIENAKAADEPVNHQKLQDDIWTYATAYQFKRRAAGAGPVDPVQNEAEKIAKSKLVEALQKRGGKWSDLKEPEKQIALVIEKYPAILDEARRRVEARKALSVELSDLDEVVPADAEAA